MDMPSWMPAIIYAVILLVFLSFYAWNHMDDSIGRQPFVMLASLTTLMLISDFISRCFIYEGFSHLIVVGATLITFLLLPSVGAEWYQYVRSILSAEERVQMNYLSHLVNILAAIGIIAVLMSPVTSWVFYFDDAGIYHRGNLFIVPALTTLCIALITDVFLLTRVHSLQRYNIRMVGAFPIPAFIGAVFSLLVPDVPWIPLGVAMSLVVLFAHIQNTGMGRDYLTGLANRKKLEELMADRFMRSQSGHKFAGIMMDVDNFKRINDTFGHSVGDIALSDTARLLQRCIRVGDVVARFGGDEFFVLLDIDKESDLEEVVERIREEERSFECEEKQYTLQLSKGYDVFNPEKFKTIQEFEVHLDALMYKNKNKHHEQYGTSPRQSILYTENRRRA